MEFDLKNTLRINSLLRIVKKSDYPCLWYSPKISKEFFKRVKRTLCSFPENVRNFLFQTQINIFLDKQSNSYNDYIASYSGSLFPSICPSVITIYEYGVVDGQFIHTLKDSYSTPERILRHEVGHAIIDNLFLRTKNKDVIKNLSQIVNNDLLNTKLDENRKIDEYFLDTKNRDDIYADIIAGILGGGARDFEILKENFPNTTKFIKEELLDYI